MSMQNVMNNKVSGQNNTILDTVNKHQQNNSILDTVNKHELTK